MDWTGVIAAARQARGLSQRELAARAGTSPAAICWYEQGTRVPRVDTLQRIVEAAGGTLTLTLTAPTIDVEANGRDLEAVLGLADHLPADHAEELTYPVLRDAAA